MLFKVGKLLVSGNESPTPQTTTQRTHSNESSNRRQVHPIPQQQKS